jgi:hypothetical protein
MMRPRKAEARLARAADGSLCESDRRELEAEVRASPEIAEELRLQGQAITFMRALDAEQAPAELHASVQSLVAAESSQKTRPRSSRRLVPVAAAAVAAVALVAVLLASSGSSAPTVNQAALLALRQPTEPAPAESPGRSPKLQRAAAGITFPYWRHELGWNTSGARNDRFASRSATTVFYTPASPAGGTARVGYTILSGTALALPKAHAVEHRGVRYLVLSDHGATVVTWRRNGHTCILAARGVAPKTLLHLAAWA